MNLTDSPSASSQQVSVARQQALDALVDLALQFRDQNAYRRAVAGNGSGTLEVSGAQRRVYAELGGVGGPVVEAQYDQFKPTLGQAVYLVRPRIFGAGGWLILGQSAGITAPCYSG